VTALAGPLAWFIEALVELHRKKTFARDRYGPGRRSRPFLFLVFGSFRENVPCSASKPLVVGASLSVVHAPCSCRAILARLEAPRRTSENSSSETVRKG
jgi:hypothetical protein